MASTQPVTSDRKSQHMLTRVLEAIGRLGERRGSSAKDILQYVLQSNETVYRNLTLQVRKALRQAVVENLVRLRGSRYKIRPRTATATETNPPRLRQPASESDVERKSKNSTEVKKSRKEVEQKVKENKLEGKSRGRRSDKKASKNAVAAKSHNTRSNAGPVTRSKSTKSKNQSNAGKSSRSRKSSTKK